MSTDAQLMTEQEIAHRRMQLALVEVGACISDIGNMLLQGPAAPKLKLGGIVIGMQRAMLAVQNKSFGDMWREPQLQATDGGSNHVYMDPILDLAVLLKEFLTHVPDETPLKEQVVEMVGTIDPTTQVEVKQINGIAIRSYRQCEFVYKNYKGEVERRKVRPTKFYYGTTEWYPIPGWLMEGLDIEKDVMRAFSCPNMTEVVFS